MGGSFADLLMMDDVKAAAADALEAAAALSMAPQLRAVAAHYGASRLARAYERFISEQALELKGC